MKRVNQLERTDRDITDALFRVMEEKPFEKITIQDILEEARNNRSTFYQHFPDKYAILERLQERYIRGIAERANTVIQSGTTDLSEINRVFLEYFDRNRPQMKKLLTVRSENLDLEGQMRSLFAYFLSQSDPRLTDIESGLMAGMLVSFFVYHLKRDSSLEDLGSQLLDLWMNMTLSFFRIDAVPDAKNRMLALVAELRGLG